MKHTFILLLGICLAIPSFSQSSSYTGKVKKMLILTGAEETFATAIDQMMGTIRNTRNDVPSELWDELHTEFKKTSLDDLVEMLAPVYFKYLDESDLDGIIEFYQSPVGKKYAKATPGITRDSMAAGEEWGVKIGQRLADRLADEGY